jgi:aminoglycoside phosphotransferase (APT) family kinase protein
VPEGEGDSVRVVTGRAPELTQQGLEEWFASRGADDASVVLQPSPDATGYSHETIIFDLSADGRTRRLVARVEPTELSVFPNPDLELEYRLLERIGDEVRVPRLEGYEPGSRFLGTPFYVMEHLDGSVPADSPPYSMGGWMHDLSPSERGEVWWNGLEAMVAAHKVDWRSRDLGFINSGRPVGMEGELQYWEHYVSFAAPDGLTPVNQRVWDWLQANAPSDGDVALCWGDSRLGNQMFDGTRCVALLDWEMACLCDPVEDLAWFCHFDELFSVGLGVSRLEGIPSKDETVARYEDLTRQPVSNFDYFNVFAAFRFVVILQRLGNLQIATGKQPPDSTFPTDNFAVNHLAQLCEEKGI